MRFLIAICTLLVLTFAGTSVKYLSTFKSDTLKVALHDSALVVNTTTTKVKNTFVDTVKLIKSDTTIAIKHDTLKTMLKVPVKVVPVVKK